MDDCPLGLDARRLRPGEQFFIDIDACFGRGETLRQWMRFVCMFRNDNDQSALSLGNTSGVPLVCKPQLKAHNRVSYMEVAIRHVRHTHRSLVRMVSSRQLVAQDDDSGASSYHKGV